MTAKEYLGQAYRIDQRINAKIEQVQSLRNLSMKATSTLTGMPGGTRDVHSRERIIAKMTDLENDINAEIDRLVGLKKEISLVIDSLDNKDYQLLLEMRYLRMKSWEEIACAISCTNRWVHIMHSRALKAVAEKI